MIYLFSKRPDPGGFSDEELQIAARAVQDAMLRSLEEESESKHIFSESFLARMNALFRKDERRNGIKRALQHAAIIVIGVFLAGALLLAFNPEVRADFTRWVKSTFEKSIFYQYFSEEKVYIPGESIGSLPDIEFGWLPSENKVQKVYDDGNHVVILLEDVDKPIVLEIWTIESVRFTEFFFDGFVREDASVLTWSGDFYQSLDSNTASVLIWTDDDAGIVFFLNASLPKDTMIKLAENIKEKKK